MLVPSMGWERAGRRTLGLRADPCARPPVVNFGSGCPIPIGQDSPRLSFVLVGMQGDIGSTLGWSVGHISIIRPTSWQASCLVFSQGSRCEIGIEIASASTHTGFLSKWVGEFVPSRAGGHRDCAGAYPGFSSAGSGWPWLGSGVEGPARHRTGLSRRCNSPQPTPWYRRPVQPGRSPTGGPSRSNQVGV
jgi:hypothetical protein